MPKTADPWRLDEGQSKESLGLFDQRYWELVGQFAEEGFNLERYEKIKDFTKEIAMVPISAREGGVSRIFWRS